MNRDEIVNAVVAIEDVLRKTNLIWSISYDPRTKSYSVFMCKENDEYE